MLILLVLHLASSKLCPVYECSPYSFNNTNQCIDKVGYTNNLAVCNDDFYSYCQITSSDSYCGLPPRTPDIDIALPGEDCVFDRNCKYSFCTVTSNNTESSSPVSKCEGNTLNQTCYDNSQCAVGFYCSTVSKTCQNQKSKGSSCLSDYDCINNLGCYNSVCTPYFTLAGSTNLTSCENNTNFLCSSGVCAEVNSDYLCIDKSIVSGSLPVLCISDDDCMFNAGYSTGCECGYNDQGFSYCNLSPGDSIYVNYTAMLYNWTNYGNITQCHTLARFSLTCISENWDYTNYTGLAYYQALVLNYPQVQQNDDCVQNIYTSEYWQAKQAFDGITPNEKESFSRVLLLGIVILELI